MTKRLTAFAAYEKYLQKLSNLLLSEEMQKPLTQDQKRHDCIDFDPRHPAYEKQANSTGYTQPCCAYTSQRQKRFTANYVYGCTTSCVKNSFSDSNLFVMLIS